MMKYKTKVVEHLDLAKQQLDKLVKWVQYDRVTKEEHTKVCENILNKIEHCSNLVELEDPKG